MEDDHYMGIPNPLLNQDKKSWSLSYNQIVALIIVGLFLCGVFAVVYGTTDEAENCSNGVCTYEQSK